MVFALFRQSEIILQLTRLITDQSSAASSILFISGLSSSLFLSMMDLFTAVLPLGKAKPFYLSHPLHPLHPLHPWPFLFSFFVHDGLIYGGFASWQGQAFLSLSSSSSSSSVAFSLLFFCPGCTYLRRFCFLARPSLFASLILFIFFIRGLFSSLFLSMVDLFTAVLPLGKAKPFYLSHPLHPLHPLHPWLFFFLLQQWRDCLRT